MTASTLDLEVAVVACDNERTIGDVLASVANLARRVIVVDSGSTDRTPAICREHGAEVIHQPWLGYVKQKQFALEQCRSTWVLALDSDEWLDDEARHAVRDAVTRDDPATAGYALNRRVRVGQVHLKHAWQPEWRTRLVRRDRARWAGYDPHDRLDVDGPVHRLRGIIVHDAFSSVKEMLAKAVGHGLTTAESYHAMGRRGSAWLLITSPAGAVFKQLVLRSAWRDGWLGWIAAFCGAVHGLAKQMRLLELTKKRV